jgi:hypothetical protein
MLVVFDHSTPAPLRFHLAAAHVVTEARERGWERLANGELLTVAEAAGFDVFLTADKNLRYQQNLTTRKIAVIVIRNEQWRGLRLYVDRVVSAVNAATPGRFTAVDIPYPL